MIVFKEYLDKFYDSFLNYIFRRTSLKRILYFLVITIIAETGTYTFSKSLAEFLHELMKVYSSGPLYYFFRLIEIFFVQGSLLAIIISFILFLVIAYLIKHENNGAFDLISFKNALNNSTNRIQNTIKESKTDKQKELDTLAQKINKLNTLTREFNQSK